MKVSRAPEKRGGTNKLWIYLTLVATVVLAGISTAYFTVGFEFLSATGDEIGLTDLGVGPAQASPVTAPATDDVPEPTAEATQPATEPVILPRAIPEVNYGEVLSEGLVDIVLPGQVTAESWYSFQVNTSTRDITLFFAIYDGDSPETIVRTVRIEEYSQQGNWSSAEVTLFYPEGPERQITFDGRRGVIILAQQYEQPYEPSMFSPGLRVAMVNQNMVLTDNTGTIRAQLQLDLSGLSDSEHIVFERSDPELVDAALSEIQVLVEQIEHNRTH